MSARPQTYTENEPMSTATTVPTPDLTAMSLPDLHAHIAHLEQTRERLTADLPELEKRAALRDPVACYDYFATMSLLERIDYEVSDAQAEVEFRESQVKPVPSWFDVGRALLHESRLAMSGHYRTVR